MGRSRTHPWLASDPPFLPTWGGEAMTVHQAGIGQFKERLEALAVHAVQMQKVGTKQLRRDSVHFSFPCRPRKPVLTSDSLLLRIRGPACRPYLEINPGAEIPRSMPWSIFEGAGSVNIGRGSKALDQSRTHYVEAR